MESVKQFSVAESFSYQAMLDEAIETILSANAELGSEQRKSDAALQEIVAPLRGLKAAHASFAHNLTVQSLSQRDFTARGLRPAPDVVKWMRTHQFYLVQVPITLMPASGWAFTQLECWVGLEWVGPEEPKVHDLYPEDVWTEIVGLQTHLRLGLDEALKFRAGLDRVDAAYKALSGQAQAKLAVVGEGGAQLVIGPFQYSVRRPQVLGRGKENSQAFWRLEGHEYVQKEEPYLALVLRVPKEVGVIHASGELKAYQQFDFLGSDLKDWEGGFRDKLKSFFSKGIPLEARATWQNITAV